MINKLLRVRFVRVAHVAAIMVAWPSSLVAQGSLLDPPDPVSLSIPDISTDRPGDLANGHKFFVFHNASVDYEQAFADITECRSFLPAGPGRPLPSFTPWVTTPAVPQVVTVPNAYGLVGGLIGSLIERSLVRGQNNTILRRCMETRGYVRFPVSERVWETVNDGEERIIAAMQARIASGPRPPQPEVSE